MSTAIQLRNQSTQSLISPSIKAALPRFGVLHKGEKAPRKENGDIARPGKDLTYFRLDTKFKDIEAVWEAAYPTPEAKRRINVVMPFATVDENFERCREHWVKGGLVHRCDGVKTSRLRDKQTGKMILEPRDCPGGCELVSRLMVLIPEMIVGTKRVGTFTLNDTSQNDIGRLKEELQVIYNWRGSLQGVPMILYRVEEMISQPKSDTDVSRVRRAKWMVHIEAGPGFAEALVSAMSREAIASPTRLSLTSNQRQLAAAAPIDNDLPVDISSLNYQEHGDDDPEPIAPEFGAKRTGEESDDDAVLSGPDLNTAMDLYAEIKDNGGNGDKFTAWLKKDFQAASIEEVKATDGARLIEALKKHSAAMKKQSTKSEPKGSLFE